MPFIVNFSFLPFVHGYVVILLLASFKDVHRMFSPISKVHTKVADPKIRDILEGGVPSRIPAGPSPTLGGTSLPSGDFQPTCCADIRLA